MSRKAGSGDQPLEIGAEVRIVGDPPQVALELAVIGGVEAGEGDEHADVGLGQPLAEEIGSGVEPALERVQHGEHGPEGLLVGLLGRGEARAIDPVVERRIDRRR